MTIIDRLHIKNTYEQRAERPVKLRINYQDTGISKVSADVFAHQTKYVLRGEVFVEFWANPAQLEKSKHRAERVMLNHMYADSIRRIDDAIYGICNDDMEMALSALDDLRKELIG
jgi:L-ribulose-5-phosphate 3-epimerase UlaE